VVCIQEGLGGEIY